MNRYAHFLLQCTDQFIRRLRLQQAGHILDSDNVCSALLKFLCHPDIILQIIFVPAGIHDVAGVAQRRLCDLALVQHLVQRDFHSRNPVQRIEDAEHVDTALRRLLHELPDDIVRIIFVPHRVRAADQHLKQDVRNLLTQLVQPLPRRFLQESVRGIEGSAAPHLQRERILLVQSHCRSDLGHIDGPHPRRHQGLLRVPHRSVGDQQFLLVQDPVFHKFRSVSVQQLLGAGQLIDLSHLDFREYRYVKLRLVPVGLVNHNIPDVAEHLKFAVHLGADVQQFRIRRDKARVASPRNEVRVVQHVKQESDIGFNPFDLGFLQRPNSLPARILEGERAGRNLDQQAVVIRGDHRTGEAVPAVQTDSKSGSAPVQFNRACIRRKSVGRILGRDPALNRRSPHVHIALPTDPDLIGIQGISLCDFNLRLYNVDACHKLRHSMLHLNSRVHLDEIVISVLIQQELHRSGTAVIHMSCDFQRVLTDRRSLLFCQTQRRRELNYLLVSSLNRAVALEQMHDVALFVPQNLDLDVLRILQIFFDENVVVSERLRRFALRRPVLIDDIRLVANHPHSTASAAGCRFQNHRVSAFISEFHGLILTMNRRLDARNCRNADFLRHKLGLDFVTQLIHHIRSRSDELDTCVLTGLSKIGVFRKETVSRVNRIYALRSGDFNYLVDSQIGVHR